MQINVIPENNFVSFYGIRGKVITSLTNRKHVEKFVKEIISVNVTDGKMVSD